MAWSTSELFRQTQIDILKGTLTADLDTIATKVALYNNSVTPDSDATAANVAYGAGTWTGNEVTGTNWAAGGVALSGMDVIAITGGYKYDATDVSVSTCTFTGAYGCLIYLDGLTTPVADQGLIAVYFGGSAFSPVAGDFTITWNASGIYTVA